MAQEEAKTVFTGDAQQAMRAWGDLLTRMDGVVEKLDKIDTTTEKAIGRAPAKFELMHHAVEGVKRVVQGLAEAMEGAAEAQERLQAKQAGARMERERSWSQVMAQADPRIPVGSEQETALKGQVTGLAMKYGAQPWQADLALKWLGSQGFGSMEEIAKPEGALEQVLKAGLAMGVVARGETLEPLARAHGKFLHATGGALTSENLRRNLIAHTNLFKETPLESRDIESLANVAAVLHHEGGWSDSEILALYSQVVDVMDPEMGATGVKRFVGALSGLASQYAKGGVDRKTGKPKKLGKADWLELLGQGDKKIKASELKLNQIRPDELMQIFHDALESTPDEADRNFILAKLFGERGKIGATFLPPVGPQLKGRMERAKDAERFEQDIANLQQSDIVAINRAKAEAGAMLDKPGAGIDEIIRTLLPLKMQRLGSSPREAEKAVERYDVARRLDEAPAMALKHAATAARPAEHWMKRAMQLDPQRWAKEVIEDLYSIGAGEAKNAATAADQILSDPFYAGMASRYTGGQTRPSAALGMKRADEIIGPHSPVVSDILYHDPLYHKMEGLRSEEEIKPWAEKLRERGEMLEKRAKDWLPAGFKAPRFDPRGDDRGEPRGPRESRGTGFNRLHEALQNSESADEFYKASGVPSPAQTSMRGKIDKARQGLRGLKPATAGNPAFTADQHAAFLENSDIPELKDLGRKFKKRIGAEGDDSSTLPRSELIDLMNQLRRDVEDTLERLRKESRASRRGGLEENPELIALLREIRDLVGMPQSISLDVGGPQRPAAREIEWVS